MTKRVLGLDSGGIRLGWAIVERDGDAYRLDASGILGCRQLDDEPFADYYERFFRFWKSTAPYAFEHDLWGWPEEIVVERLPLILNSKQATMTRIAMTFVKSAAMDKELKWREIAASTVKKKLTEDGKASKAVIRNAVISVFPSLTPRKKTILADETDAIAIGLVGLGYDCKTNAAAQVH